MIKKILKNFFKKKGFHSPGYWEKRYAAGGNSGDGSYGRLSEFKAAVINGFIRENNIQTALELGCGDGHQLSLIEYPSYTGMDVSSTVIETCKKKFSADNTKNFFVYKPAAGLKSMQKADMVLSLDVLYHIVEEGNYLQYLHDLFSNANHFVMIYSTNFNQAEAQHIQHRKFTDTVKETFHGWELWKEFKNPYHGTGIQESLADFFIFRKIN